MPNLIEILRISTIFGGVHNSFLAFTIWALCVVCLPFALDAPWPGFYSGKLIWKTWANLLQLFGGDSALVLVVNLQTSSSPAVISCQGDDTGNFLSNIFFPGILLLFVLPAQYHSEGHFYFQKCCSDRVYFRPNRRVVYAVNIYGLQNISISSPLQIAQFCTVLSPVPIIWSLKHSQ